MRRYWRLLIAALAVALTPHGALHAQADQRCFTETGYCISGRIRAFWEQNGGLAVFGYPRGPQQQELVEGQSYTVQRFERARFELHPQNAPPYDVLLGRLGADRLAQQGRAWQQFPGGDGDADCLRFETGHSACGAILAAWRASGLEFDGRPGASFAESLALFGQPLSPPQPEIVEGRTYTVQWYERARFELHPENQPPYDVLLGRLDEEIRVNAEPTPSRSSSNPDVLTTFGPWMFFVADDGAHGRELWRSNGTAEGTTLLADLLPGPASSSPYGLVAANGLLFFSARASEDGPDLLWRSDGTAQGTYAILPAEQLRMPLQITPVGDAVFFVGEDDAHGQELWRSDGTHAGTRMVTEIYPGPRGIYPYQNMPMGYLPFALTRVGDQLFFNAESPGVGYGLWRSDGTAEGTALVSRLNTGDISPEYWELTALGEQLLFVGRTGQRTYGLWRSDGTPAGTALVYDFSYPESAQPGLPTRGFYPPLGGLRRAGGLVFFNYGAGLWRSDGTPAGTFKVAEGAAADLVEFGGAAYFLPAGTPEGLELWRSDGTPAGTALVSRLAPEMDLANGSLIAAGRRLYAVINAGGSGALWVSDGTPAGGRRVTTLHGRWLAGWASVEGFRPAAALGEQLVLLGDDGMRGAELWRSDGTPAGTALLADINTTAE